MSGPHMKNDCYIHPCHSIHPTITLFPHHKHNLQISSLLLPAYPGPPLPSPPFPSFPAPPPGLIQLLPPLSSSPHIQHSHLGSLLPARSSSSSASSTYGAFWCSMPTPQSRHIHSSPCRQVHINPLALPLPDFPLIHGRVFPPSSSSSLPSLPLPTQPQHSKQILLNRCSCGISGSFETSHDAHTHSPHHTQNLSSGSHPA